MDPEDVAKENLPHVLAHYGKRAEVLFAFAQCYAVSRARREKESMSIFYSPSRRAFQVLRTDGTDAERFKCKAFSDAVFCGDAVA